jgi:hypothetical protein
MPEEAHGSGVVHRAPESRDRSDGVICQVIQGPGRPRDQRGLSLA